MLDVWINNLDSIQDPCHVHICLLKDCLQQQVQRDHWFSIAYTSIVSFRVTPHRQVTESQNHHCKTRLFNIPQESILLLNHTNPPTKRSPDPVASWPLFAPYPELSQTKLYINNFNLYIIRINAFNLKKLNHGR